MNYCLEFAVVKPAADVFLAVSTQSYSSSLIQSTCHTESNLRISLWCIFHPAKWNGKWRRNKSALRKTHESLERSEHLVLRDTVHVFYAIVCGQIVCVWAKEYVCSQRAFFFKTVCMFKGRCLYLFTTAPELMRFRAEKKPLHFNSLASGAQHPAVQEGAAVAELYVCAR